MSDRDCSSAGGIGSGQCAQGFGVCCSFVTDECVATIRNNHTYIRNPGFPSAYDGDSSTCKYTVQTIRNDIHHLRLDFETFSIKGPSSTTENSDTGGECLDSFRVMV